MFAKRQLPSHMDVQTIKDEEDELSECNLQLLGVTALEDVLQDEVKECIYDFTKAKIKVWMLTGDKCETAHTIGISCGLINDK